MVESKQFNFNIPPGGGMVSVVISGDEVTITAVAAREQAPPKAAPSASPVGDVVAQTDQIEALLTRFEYYDPQTNARDLRAAMVSRGWNEFVPEPRGGKAESDSAYVRLVYLGSKRRVTLYLTSAALVSGGVHERPLVEALPNADVRKRDVYINHTGTRRGSIEQAMGAVELLESFANGAAAAV